MKFKEKISHRTTRKAHKLHHIENYVYVPVVTLKFSEKLLASMGLQRF
jgi:hypothetical protein